MVSMSSLDAINIDDGFDTKKFANQFKAFKDEMQQVVKHCNMLIERNNIKMGGVWIVKRVSLI